MQKYILSWDTAQKPHETAITVTRIENSGARIVGTVVFSSTDNSGAVCIDDIIARAGEIVKSCKSCSPPSSKLLYVATEIYELKNIDGLTTQQLLNKIEEKEQRK